MSHAHDDDVDTNNSNNPAFENVLSARVTRRNMLSGGAGAAALAVIGTTAASAAMAHGGQGQGQNQGGGYGGGYDNDHRYRKLKLNFNPVAKNLDDAVTLPRGYSYDVLYALGDPLAGNVSDFANDGTDSAASFALRAGDHHDGMYFFGLGHNGRYDSHVSSRALLCMNHEAITPAFLHPAGQTIVGNVRTVPEEVQREFYAHGVSVLEIVRERGRRREDWSSCYRRRYKPGRGADWDYQQRSRFNRRIHTLTEIKLSGPAAGSPFMITKYSPNGSRTRGTVN